jgi:hypothetical protein
MLIATRRTRVPIDSPPGPVSEPLDPDGGLDVAVRGVDPDWVLPGAEEGWPVDGPVDGPVAVVPGPVDGAPPVALDPEPAPVPGEDPPELGAWDVTCELGPTGPEPGGLVAAVVHPTPPLAHGGGGGYGALGVAAAVATTLPSRNIRPATRNPADLARPIGRRRPRGRDDLDRPGMVRMARAFPRKLYEPFCPMYMRCSSSGLHQ